VDPEQLAAPVSPSETPPSAAAGLERIAAASESSPSDAPGHRSSSGVSSSGVSIHDSGASAYDSRGHQVGGLASTLAVAREREQRDSIRGNHLGSPSATQHERAMHDALPHPHEAQQLHDASESNGTALAGTVAGTVAGAVAGTAAGTVAPSLSPSPLGARAGLPGRPSDTGVGPCPTCNTVVGRDSGAKSETSRLAYRPGDASPTAWPTLQRAGEDTARPIGSPLGPYGAPPRGTAHAPRGIAATRRFAREAESARESIDRDSANPDGVNQSSRFSLRYSSSDRSPEKLSRGPGRRVGNATTRVDPIYI